MKKTVMMALCAFVQTAGLTLVPQQAMAAATPLADGTKLWDGRATFHTQNGEMWIEGQDLGDPDSPSGTTESLPFSIKLIPLTKEHVNQLWKMFCTNKKRIENNKQKMKKEEYDSATKYMQFLGSNLGDGFKNVIYDIDQKKKKSYAIMKKNILGHWNDLVGFVYDEKNPKVYVDFQKGKGGAAAQAYTTYIRGMNESVKGDVSLLNIRSLGAVASAVNRGRLRCECQDASGQWTQISAQDIRTLINLDSNYFTPTLILPSTATTIEKVVFGLFQQEYTAVGQYATLNDVLRTTMLNLRLSPQ